MRPVWWYETVSLDLRNVSEGVLVDVSETTPTSTDSASSPDSDLRLAMELSARAQEEEERRRKEEEEELERILQLSLTEKWPKEKRERDDGRTKGKVHFLFCSFGSRRWHTTSTSCSAMYYIMYRSVTPTNDPFAKKRIVARSLTLRTHFHSQSKDHKSFFFFLSDNTFCCYFSAFPETTLSCFTETVRE